MLFDNFLNKHNAVEAKAAFLLNSPNSEITYLPNTTSKCFPFLLSLLLFFPLL